MSDFRETLDFWLGKTESLDFGKVRKMWFDQNEEVDREITDRFTEIYELAAAGSWDS
jgi:uncharacterized protein (DUF924 family)